MLSVSQNILSFLDSTATNIISEYDEATTYIGGDEVRVDSRIYKSISDANVGNYPPDNIDTFWMDWEASNEHAMLDLFEDTATQFPATGVVTFERTDHNEVIAIGNYDAETVTIEYLDDLDVVLDTETYISSFIGGRVDAYSYIYADFEASQIEVVYRPLQRLGIKIRVTFIREGLSTYCGFMVSGKVVDLGDTLDVVNLNNKIVGYERKRVATFTTIMDKDLLMTTLELGEAIFDEPLLFIIDPNENSSHSNIVMIAKVSKCEGSGENNTKNKISWELTQN